MDAHRLLEEACIKLGYCVPANEQQRLIQAPPVNIDTFTDAILAAEGLDPAIVQKRQRNELRDLVARHFESS